ncbi:MAG: sulfide/dihydroorotate dehydrogenase-like FAD/NAD-binding protein [Clostridia bacterium]|nr:sulfide/dihydroorotate dehydrogenase-like FAD/NAD-binding protein [Clostridia bacterium]
MYDILRKQELAPSIKLMEIYAPLVAKKAQAGQFIILRLDTDGERIPLTIADFDRDKGTITTIFQEVGFTTKRLGELEAGDRLLDFVGPLGRPTEIEQYGTVVCVGGGVGIAPIYPIARALKQAGNEVIGIIGSRTKNLLILEQEMGQVVDQLIVCTDDGSYGRHGFVTEALEELLKTRTDIARVWGIGPVIMMKNVARTTLPFGVKTIVSMNPIMVDGTGMCGACRVGVGGETKFACVDGPEFDGHLVDWDLAVRRLSFYHDEERRIQQVHQHGGDCQCR